MALKLATKEFGRLPRIFSASVFQNPHLFGTTSSIPGDPKKPLTAHSLFVRDNFATLKQQNQSLQPTELMKLLSARYRELSESEKEAFRKAAEKDKQRYKSELAALSSSTLKAIEQAKVDRKKEKAEKQFKKDQTKNRIAYNMPTAPLRPYNVFVRQTRESGSRDGESGPEFMKRASQEWKALTEEKKNKYKKVYEMESASYQKQLDEWKKKMIKNGKEKEVIELTSLTKSTADNRVKAVGEVEKKKNEAERKRLQVQKQREKAKLQAARQKELQAKQRERERAKKDSEKKRQAVVRARAVEKQKREKEATKEKLQKEKERTKLLKAKIAAALKRQATAEKKLQATKVRKAPAPKLTKKK